MHIHVYIFISNIYQYMCMSICMNTYIHTPHTDVHTAHSGWELSKGINERNVYVHKGALFENSQRIKGNLKKGCNGLSVSLKTSSMSKSL